MRVHFCRSAGCMTKKTKASLRTRILLCCLTLSLVTVLVGGFGLYSLRNVVERYDHVATVNLPHSLMANEMLSTMRRFRIGLRTVALPQVSPSEAKEAVGKAEGAIASFDKNLTDY